MARPTKLLSQPPMFDLDQYRVHGWGMFAGGLLVGMIIQKFIRDWGWPDIIVALRDVFVSLFGWLGLS